jgi:hypothetical protein
MSDRQPAPGDPTSLLLAGHRALGTRIWVEVLGGSMGPLLENGDTVLITLCSAEEIREGDLAVFGEFGRLLAHRILKRSASPRGTLFLEKGDGTPWGRWLGPEKLRGRVQAVRGRGKYLDLEKPAWRRWNRWAARTGYGYMRISAFFLKGLRGGRSSGEVLGPFRGYGLLLKGFFLLPIFINILTSLEKKDFNGSR